MEICHNAWEIKILAFCISIRKRQNVTNSLLLQKPMANVFYTRNADDSICIRSRVRFVRLEPSCFAFIQLNRMGCQRLLFLSVIKINGNTASARRKDFNHKYVFFSVSFQMASDWCFRTNKHHRSYGCVAIVWKMNIIDLEYFMKWVNAYLTSVNSFCDTFLA